MERTIRFKKLKGKTNFDLEQFAIRFSKDVSVRELDKVMEVKFKNIVEYKKAYFFLKRYVFMQLDCDITNRTIYMPLDYIHSVKKEFV